MVFSSITFLLYFLPAVIAVYFLAPAKIKNTVLLIASLVFYAWGEPVYIILMIFSIVMNYSFGLLIGKAREQDAAPGFLKLHMGVIAALNLALLFYFKYCNMLIGWINNIFSADISPLELSLPIGISFYTFQALSYVIDVYRGNTKAQRNILDFGLYISMFPQLIAGPIVRYSTIEKQLHDHPVTIAGVKAGIFYFIKGLVKKVLLANTLGALFAAVTTGGTSNLAFLTAWLGAIAYTLQLYYDFSGYSDMAIGLGRIFGFKFQKNFDHPYVASSVTDFWRRWHISLSSWFREYVYIPLGGNRVSKSRHILNLLIVWLLTGLWHGASLNFILWGLYYGVWLILEKYVFGGFTEKHRLFSRIYTGIVFIFGWMLFVFTDFGELKAFLGSMLGFGGAFADHTTLVLILTYGITAAAGIIFATPLPGRRILEAAKKHSIMTAAIFAVMFILCLASLAYESYNPFLYFRF
ncbi:MAG: MBOAT family protein [Lachnospiraceae bacterium]|nr:MBOAT family protein [Lachnospiraceae bacterium]